MNLEDPRLGIFDLEIKKLIHASPERVYRAWTQPAFLKEWFAPAPWTTTSAELDVRVGGTSTIVMKSPEGLEYPSSGVYLEVVENRRLVYTDAYSKNWKPSKKPFMTVVLDFIPHVENTNYIARVCHWSEEDCESHKRMGFYEGWSLCTEQLAKYAMQF